MNRTLTGIVGGLFLLGIFGTVVYFGFFSNHESVDKADWQKREAKMQDFDDRLKALAKKIESLQGHSVCTQDDQCRVVGIGTPICGEYKDFVIYSVTDAEEGKLLEAVHQFNKLHEGLSDLSLTAETCGHKPARIMCVQKHCEPDLSKKTD